MLINIEITLNLNLSRLESNKYVDILLASNKACGKKALAP